MRRSLTRHLSPCAIVFAFFAFTNLTSNAQSWYIPFDFAASLEPAVDAAAAPPGYYYANQACIQSVIDADDYCVTSDWDEFCNADYLACLGCTELTWFIPAETNAGPAVYDCVAPVGYYAPDQACVLNIVLADGFCTDDSWDGLCQAVFENCAFGCDASWHIPIIASNGPAVLNCLPDAGYYTPANQACVEQTIAADTYCITTSWDALCQSDFEACAFGCDAQWHIPYSTSGTEPPVFDCTAPPGYMTPDQNCAEEVIANDPVCIEFGWDQICQDDYELCFLGCDAQYYIPLVVGTGPAVLACPGTEPAGYWSPSVNCIQIVINADSYCVGTSWDLVCQIAFEDCFYGCNAQWYLPFVVSSTQPAVLACSAPLGYEFAAGQDCVESTVAGDPYCLVSGWDQFCEASYESCYLGCTYSFACNYNPTAVVEDGTCGEAGCTDSGALNYTLNAVCDNGSCIYGSCPGDFNTDGLIGTGDLLDFLGVFGTVCP